MYSMGSAWFTFAEKRKGSIEVGKLADLAVLNADYLTVAEDQIRSIESVLTMVGGRVAYGSPFRRCTAEVGFVTPQRRVVADHLN